MNGQRLQRWAPVVATAIAVAFGVGLRWWGLGTKSLWFDEGYTAWVVSLPPRPLVDAVRVDTAPPLYYLLLHGWTRLAGTSEVALRAPSAAAATAALAVTLLVARRLFADPWARAAAGVLVACSFMQVAYGHEARFYAAMSLAGAVGLYVMLRACDGERRSAGWLAATAIAGAVSLWLNNIMVVYVGCLGLAWLVAPGRRPLGGRLADVAIAGTVAGLSFAPWVPTLLAQARAVEANFWSVTPTTLDLISVARQTAGADDGWAKWAALAVGLAVVWATVVARPATRRAAATLAAVGLVPVLLAFAYSHGRRSIFIDRAFIVSSVAVPLLAAVPLEVSRGRQRWAAGGLAALLVTGAANVAVADRYHTPDHDEDWRAACRYAAATDPPLVVFTANEGEMLYDYYARHGDYAPRPGLTGTPAGYFAGRPPHTMQRVTADADVTALARRLDARPATVVLVWAHEKFSDAGGRTLSLLRSRCREVDHRAFPAVTVYRFAGRGR